MNLQALAVKNPLHCMRKLSLHLSKTIIFIRKKSLQKICHSNSKHYQKTSENFRALNSTGCEKKPMIVVSHNNRILFYLYISLDFHSTTPIISKFSNSI